VVVPSAHRHLHISIRQDTIYTILYKRPTYGTDDARAMGLPSLGGVAPTPPYRTPLLQLHLYECLIL